MSSFFSTLAAATVKDASKSGKQCARPAAPGQAALRAEGSQLGLCALSSMRPVRRTENRSAGDRFGTLPRELQLRVLEDVHGSDLCAVESVCCDLRQLVAKNSHVYRNALSKEFGVAPPVAEDSSTWKAAYVQAVVQARLDALEGQQSAFNALKLRLAELDDLLEQADEMKVILGSPELGSDVMCSFVGDMEQDVLQQRWETSEELMTAEAQMQVLQRDVTALLARMPRDWRQAAPESCTIA